jgi:NhaP-type Na+/H+ or K+/H+ antiporter
LNETETIALVILAASVSQLLAVRLRIPAIVPLLAAGMLVGPYLLDLLNPDDLLGDLLQPMVNLAVGVILFEGSLSLRRSQLASQAGAGTVVFRLITLGVLITWAAGTVGAVFLLDLDIRIALILGAILTLSGPTVVLPLLSFIRPQARLATVLRWEGVLIDPIGAIIAVLTYSAIIGTERGFEPGGLLLTFAVGIVVGIVVAGLLAPILRSSSYSHALKSAMTLALVLGAVALATTMREDAGLVAAVAMGIALANGLADVIEETRIFTETLVELLIGALFILLAARVDPGEIAALGLGGVAFVALLVLLVRPAAVAVSTWGSQLSGRERSFLAWMMPRGIVAAATVSAFQLELEQRGIPDAEALVPATFLVIAATVLIYGLTGGPVADMLGVRERRSQDDSGPAPVHFGARFGDDGERSATADERDGGPAGPRAPPGA